MSQYTEQAKQFLKDCNATMEIKPVGLEKPNWDSKNYHAVYDCTITTPRGSMTVHFTDSLVNSEFWTMSPKEWYRKKIYRDFDHLSYTEQQKLIRQFKKDKENAVPSEYSILACLQKYDVGDMDNFMDEFGYEIHCTVDMTNFINTYNAVVKEYNDVRRCFTEEQIKALCDIN